MGKYAFVPLETCPSGGSTFVLVHGGGHGGWCWQRLARELRADLPIVARARDAAHAGELYALGVTDAVPETVEASLQLSEAVLVDVGVPMGLVIASIHEKRDQIRKELNRPDALGGRRKRLRRTSEQGASV